jgi:hypothetical protein
MGQEMGQAGRLGPTGLGPFWPISWPPSSVIEKRAERENGPAAFCSEHASYVICSSLILVIHDNMTNVITVLLSMSLYAFPGPMDAKIPYAKMRI